ncbi:MAG: hypothetical protein KDA37_10735, partial [Planctomycetales bacterium]|nr:hypothetical protein [Planctomycetales bacterium]
MVNAGLACTTIDGLVARTRRAAGEEVVGAEVWTAPSAVEGAPRRQDQCPRDRPPGAAGPPRLP